MGVSSKFINIVRAFYENAFACVRTDQGNTDFVRVTQGLLQVEVLSPNLFSLYLSDMEKFLLDKGCRGLAINSLLEVLLLAYADDLVLLSDSPVKLNKKLLALDLYCNKKWLED